MINNPKTDKWQMAQNFTDDWHLDQILTDNWHLHPSIQTLFNYNSYLRIVEILFSALSLSSRGSSVDINSYQLCRC